LAVQSAPRSTTGSRQKGAAQAASSIARQARSGGCIAYLGADTAVQADWNTLLSRLRSSSRLITALNELAVTKDA
jgi:hypothetical protein